jgi:hypothetical protein
MAQPLTGTVTGAVRSASQPPSWRCRSRCRREERRLVIDLSQWPSLACRSRCQKRRQNKDAAADRWLSEGSAAWRRRIVRSSVRKATQVMTAGNQTGGREMSGPMSNKGAALTNWPISLSSCALSRLFPCYPASSRLVPLLPAKSRFFPRIGPSNGKDREIPAEPASRKQVIYKRRNRSKPGFECARTSDELRKPFEDHSNKSEVPGHDEPPIFE